MNGVRAIVEEYSSTESFASSRTVSVEIRGLVAAMSELTLTPIVVDGVKALKPGYVGRMVAVVVIPVRVTVENVLGRGPSL